MALVATERYFSGSAFDISVAMALAKALTGAQPACGFSGETTCSPLPPDVLTKAARPASSKRRLSSCAASITASQATSSPGSISMVIMSGFSQLAVVAPHGWISSAADCTSAIRPSKSVMRISGSPPLSLGSLICSIALLMPRQACFWKNRWPSMPSGQRNSASGRLTTKGAICRQTCA
ncbi:hypothetical protein EN41_22145 [Agrobacterium tumefaciens]|nr:hypothetical protein EN41_22145 [Agrobacterium tumefaciens]